MSINQRQQKIIEEFSMFGDWMDRYNYLIELGNELKPIDPKYKTDEYLISGCQSKVWLTADYREGKMYYAADSDALIVKGIAALLLKVLNDTEAKEIVDNDLFFIDEVGLKENLSPTRSNGLVSMVKKMKLYALAYAAKQEN